MKELKAGFFGCGGNSFLVTDYLRKTIEDAGYKLIVCSEWDNADVKWGLNTWKAAMNDCDVVLCPQRVEVQAAKSNVKVTTAMALGMPVIASRIKSYEEVIRHGENGYICDSMDDWSKALIELKDPEKRKQVGTAAKNSIGQYTQDYISTQWITTFNKILSEEIKEVNSEPMVSELKSRDLIDIIIPNYQNLDYLKMCLTSIRLNTTHPYNLIISDAGSGEEVWGYLRTLQGITVLGSPTQRKTYSEACNSGIEASNTKYLVILNSDVIVSSGWLTNLVDKMDSVERLAACGVLSNCDRGWLFRAPEDTDPRLSQLPVYPMTLMKSGVNLHPGMKKDEIEPHIEELYKFMEDSNKANKGKFVRQSWVAGYATIYARTAINEVGLFDTQYKNGCEDSDLCLRLAKSYFSMGQAIDSFVFHFGGVTRTTYQGENKEVYDKEDMDNHIKYRTKWAKQRVWIYTGPAHEPWDKAKVDAGMAGSETWATYLGEAFARKGYDVRIYNDLNIEDKALPKLEPVYVDNELVGAVTYRHYTNMYEDLKYDHIDYFISSRTVQPFLNNVHSCKKFVMVHDIWLSNDPNYDLQAWQVFKYAYLSEWHKNFLIHHHKMPSEKMFLTGNGVVQDLYKDVDLYTKKNKIVYSSSPDRGLYQLLQMFPAIKKEVPDLELVVGYGFFNWKSFARQRGDTASIALMEKIEGLMNQPGVTYLDRVDKKTLAYHQMEAKVWVMPTWFSETFCCHPDNEIVTDKGFKRIVDLTMTDKVLTHKGRFRRIEKILSRKVNEELLGLIIKNHTADIGYYTPEHPILRITSKVANKIKRNKEMIKEQGIISDWVSIKDIHVGDYVCLPTIKESTPVKYYELISDMKDINRNYRVYGNNIMTRKDSRYKTIPSKILMNEEFARFLGLYFSEGSFSGGCIKFSFHKKEEAYISFVREYIKNTFGYETKVSTKNNCSIVSCYCNSLGEWLKRIFGREASKKDVPHFVFMQSYDFIKSFIKGVFEGDGSKNANEYKIDMATKRGIMSLKLLCSKIGLHPSFRRTKHGDDGNLDYYALGLSSSLWSKIFDEKQKDKTYEVFLEYDGQVYYRIKNINRKQYEGYVYNLEVEEDNSYVSNFVAVHNCITAVENGLAKNALLSTDFAGLSTTVGDSGILLPYDPQLTRDEDYPKDYSDRFISESIRLFKDESYRKEWANKAYNKMKEYTWDNIAEGWIKQFKA